MEIQLKERTQETVAIYFEKAQNPKIKKSLPQKAQSLEEAVNDYKKTLLPGAISYGKTIWGDEIYVGDSYKCCRNLFTRDTYKVSVNIDWCVYLCI